MTRDPRAEIEEIVDRETRAWDTQDVELLLSVLHPDMVWPWPPRPDAHDPMDWVMVLGRYDRARWRPGWHVDTLWRSHAGVDQHWRGRACKIYTRLDREWKMIAQTGLLDYPR